MANSVVKFYRGPQASYNSTTHANGIYFATDTKKIIMNGTEYGGDSNKKVSNVALNANANEIVITYTDSTSTTLLLGKATVTVDGLMSKEDKAKLDSLDPTAVTNQLANKVDKVEGSGLISDTDLNQIRTNKADIANLQTSVGGKQEALTAGDAVEISEANVIDVKIDPVSDNILAKSESGLRVNRARVAGNNIKVGVAITGGAEIGADQTVAEGMKALSDSIKTAVTGGITSITSPDNTIKVTGEGTSRGLAVDMSKLVSTSSSIQVGTDGKLDIFWSEIE